jgi:hypothetical protein
MPHNSFFLSSLFYAVTMPLHQHMVYGAASREVMNFFTQMKSLAEHLVRAVASGARVVDQAADVPCGMRTQSTSKGKMLHKYMFANSLLPLLPQEDVKWHFGRCAVVLNSGGSLLTSSFLRPW